MAKQKKSAQKKKNKKQKQQKAKKSSGAKKTEVFCNYAVETSLIEMRLVFDCKECALEADLKNDDCMRGVLKGLAQNFNSDTVILSDYAELRYSGSSMQMLKRMVELSNEIDNLAMRNPAKEYFPGLKSQGAKDKRKAACNSCNICPQKMFPGLRRSLLEDIEVFYKDMATYSKLAKKESRTECQSCKDTTEEALVYLFNLTEKFRSFLYYEGFRVVI